jgi:hypothetical protein
LTNKYVIVTYIEYTKNVNYNNFSEKVIFTWKIMSRVKTSPHIFATGAYMAKETLVQMVTELFNVKAFNHGVFSNVTPSQIIGQYSEAARSKNLPPVPTGTTVYHTVSPNGLGAFAWKISSQPASPLFNKNGHILFNAGSIFRYNWAETRSHLGIVSSLYHVYDSNGQLLASSPTNSAGSNPASILVLVSTRGKFAWVLVRNGVSANIAPVIASLQRAGYNVVSTQQQSGSGNQSSPNPNNQQSGSGNQSSSNPNDQSSCSDSQPTCANAVILEDAVSCEPKKVVCFSNTKDVNPFSTMVTYLNSDCSDNDSSSNDSDSSSSSSYRGQNQQAFVDINYSQNQGQSQNQNQQTFATLMAQNQQSQQNGNVANSVVNTNVNQQVQGQKPHNNVFNDTIVPTNGPFRNRIDQAALDAEQDVKRAWIQHHPQNYTAQQVQQAETTSQIYPSQVAATTRDVNHGANNYFSRML